MRLMAFLCFVLIFITVWQLNRAESYKHDSEMNELDFLASEEQNRNLLDSIKTLNLDIKKNTAKKPVYHRPTKPRPVVKQTIDSIKSEAEPQPADTLN